jgi:hypothetical protein
MVYAVALGILLFVSFLALAAQWLDALFVEAKVWRKVSHPRKARKLYIRPGDKGFPVGRTLVWTEDAGSSGLLTTSPTEDGEAGTDHPRRSTLVELPVLSWADDQEHWQSRARDIRTSFLDRTQATAEKWRNIFAGLLGIFGVVVVVNKPNLADTSHPEFLRHAMVVVIALALQAVAYTGWAAAGLPKMLVDVDPPSAFQEEMRQGARALSRLRVGIIAGGLTAVALTVVVAGALA